MKSTQRRTCLRSMASILLTMSLGGTPAWSRPYWTPVFESAPARYEFAKDLPDKYAILRQGPQSVTGTIRFRLAITPGASRLQIHLTNEEGKQPLAIQAATIGLAADGFDAAPGTLVPLTFAGKTDILIPAGAPAVSDAVALKVPPLGDVVVSIYVPGGLALEAVGGSAMMLGAGNQALAQRLTDPKTIPGRPFVRAVYSELAHPARTIVAFGDSLTAGNRFKLDELHGWPEALARRIVARGQGNRLTVVNAGIAGNRVLCDGMGISALARLDRDALALPGVTDIIMMEGGNDIGLAGNSELFGPAPSVTADDLIAGYRQFIERAHTHGIRVIGGTITPSDSEASRAPDKQAVRLAVNQWIRSSGAFDAVIDFEAVVRDPSNPLTLRTEFDSGDHTHPNDKGYQAMGDAINLKLFN